jgi:hypothetical protein
MPTKEIIAVFGATGGTGKSFVEAALEEGYKVQALVRTPSKVEKRENLKIIQGDLSKVSSSAIQETIKGATYVVSVAGGRPGDKTYYPTMMSDLVKMLWPLLEAESSVKYFLYQAGCLCPKPDGSNPFSMKILRPIVGFASGTSKMIDDNCRSINWIDSNPPKTFKAIVIRPGLLKDLPGGDTLEASQSAPNGTAVAYKDLGKFILKAMTDDSLVGQYPFVVKAAAEAQ